MHIIHIQDGHARISGRTLKAERVARMHVNAGAPIDEIMQHYDLSRAEVHAALAYYYENQTVLDTAYETAIQAGYDAGAIDSHEMKAIIEKRRTNDKK